ncbi:MAG: YqgE/AlgH family protein [Solimicrobium sp.]|jgi:putative transcriptional regulator|nr:YqgE/AlgH family protein [Solimicrobium sp.]
MTAQTKIHYPVTEPSLKLGSLPHANFMPISDLNLVNHFLIAMPSIREPIFDASVIFICEHNEHGALGVVINKPTDMTVETLLERIDIKTDNTPDNYQITKKLVMFGGPVQEDRGFVLHAPAKHFSSSIKISDQIAFTTSRDVLEAVASGVGPKQLLVSVGYTAWGAGQLEEELIKNGWLTVAADPLILFDLSIEQRYSAAMKLLGIDPLMLSAEAGHA